MAYYYQGEGGKTYMSQLFIGSSFVNEKTHQKIIDNKDKFMEIANRFTVDCELSRKKGTPVCSPKIEWVTIGCVINHRGEDLTLRQLKDATYVTYWLNCHAQTPQAISSCESNQMEPLLRELFNKITKD